MLDLFGLLSFGRGVFGNNTDINSVKALRALNDFVGDVLAGFQGFVAVHSDGRVVNKEIFTITLFAGKNESIAFGVIEPLHFSCWHRVIPLVLQMLCSFN